MSLRIISVVVVVICLVVGVQPVVAGQGDSEDRYRSRERADGQPDISGIWRNDTLTPLERPLRLGDQQYYTGEEIVALERRNLESLEQDNALGGRRTEVGGSLAAGYNRFWHDTLESVVYTGRTSMVVDPPTGRVPTMPAAEARARWLVEHRTDGHEYMSPYSRCITRGMPGSMVPNTYNTGNHILQVPGYVVILYEMVREPRIIPLDGRPHLDSKITQWMGDARGRWDGDTLVVETTNFTEKGWITPNQNSGRMHGVPVSHELRLVERFSRVSEDSLDWEVRIEDPRVYSQPWTLALPLRRDMDYTLYEYACHEGNRAVTGILGGQRFVERRGEDDE